MVEIVSDDGDREAILTDDDIQVRARLYGLPQLKAFEIFGHLVGRGYACSVKHQQGNYFVEVPIGLRGDPCYQQDAEIQALAKRAGCRAIQTGRTMRIVG